MRQVLGLYIHIPFCMRKCNYCDFYSIMADPEWIRRYADAVISDMKIQSQKHHDSCFDTLFIGGGTPSVMGVDLIRIVDAAKDCFSFTEDAELTCEVNPESVSLDWLFMLRQAGINRVSMGAQSFCDAELRDLGRIHNRSRIIEAYGMLRDAGFNNINLDLMFGIGHISCQNGHLQTFSETLDAVLALDVPHISCYNLTVQEDTPLWWESDRYRFPNDGEEEQMYEMLCRRLAKHGYDHYEISNFAKPGYYCRHNVKYWSSQPYLGIGPAAHSFLENRRYSYPADLVKYVAGEMPDITEEILTDRVRARERLITGLRMSTGVGYEELRDYFDINNMEILVQELYEHGLMLKRTDGFSLSEKGFRISNAIINRLLEFEKGDR